MNQNSQKAEQFIQNFESIVTRSNPFFFKHASQGWGYAVNREASFIDASVEKIDPKQGAESKNFEMHRASYDAQQCLDRLQNIQDPLDLWASLRELVSTCNNVLCGDDFSDASDLEASLKRAMGSGVHNILVLGTGIVGLAFANLVKTALGDAVNIVMIENRVAAPHIKKPYSRDWLTEIPFLSMSFLDPQVLKIIERFVSDIDVCGVPINMIETLLLLSCRKQGVKFLFLEDYDLNFIADTQLSFVIDATGNRLQIQEEFKPGSLESLHLKGDKDLELKPEGRMLYPYFEGRRIQIPCIKVMNFPVACERSFRDYILASMQNKTSYQYYMWKGALPSEHNSMLALVSLGKHSYNLLARSMPVSIMLDEFLESNLFYQLDEECGLKKFLNFASDYCDALDVVQLEPPHIFAPYLYNIKEGFLKLHGFPVIPLGDSLFNGSPKVGNGLRRHLHFLYALYQEHFV